MRGCRKGRSVRDDGATLFLLSRGGVGGGTGGGGGTLILSVPEIVDNFSRLKWAPFFFFFHGQKRPPLFSMFVFPFCGTFSDK